MAAVLMAAPLDLRSAEESYRQTRYQEALKSVQPFLLNSAEANFLAGRAAYGMDDFRKASDYFEAAIGLDPSPSRYYHWLGRAFGRRAETSFPLTAPRYASKARQNFERAVELDGRNGEALSDLFEYYLQAPGFLGGGVDKAEALLPRIKNVDPAEFEFAAAKLAEERKDFAAAEAHLRRAVELAPKSVGRLLDVAQFLARRGRFQESVEWLNRAAKHSPKDPAVLFQTARLYIEAKQNLPAAQNLLREYLRAPLNPDLPSRAEAEKLLKKASGGN